MLRCEYGRSRQCHIRIWKVVLSTVELLLSGRWLSGPPIIRTALPLRANIFPTVIVLHHLMDENFFSNSQMYIIKYIFVFHLYVNKYEA